MSAPRERLAELGIVLPEAPPPAAAYVPWVHTGGQLLVSGQVAVRDGELLATGKVGEAVDVDTAIACARQCAINVLAQAQAALGDLARVRQVVRLGVFVASLPAFTGQHTVANGASELVAAVFGDAGRHARSAVGAAALPLDSPVEVEAVLQIA